MADVKHPHIRTGTYPIAVDEVGRIVKQLNERQRTTRHAKSRQDGIALRSQFAE